MMSGGNPIVFFDLETTGLDTSSCDIIQVAAVCGKNKFNVFHVPRVPISPGASETTGLVVVDGVLQRNGQPLYTVPLTDALASFISYLGRFGRPLLAAHNGARYDVPVLARALQEASLTDVFQEAVSGFLDTLPLSRELHPDLESHSLRNLVETFIGEPFDAHNGLADAQVLQQMYELWSPSKEVVRKFTFQLDQVTSPDRWRGSRPGTRTQQ